MKTKFLKRVLWLMIPLLTMFTTNVWGADQNITPATSGWSSTAGSQTGTVGVITVSTTRGVYNTQMRVYAGESLTVSCSSGYKITKIVFTANSTSHNKLDSPVSWSGTTGTYTNASGTTSVTISSPSQTRLTKIVVTYEASASYSVVWTINPAAGGTLSTTSGTSTTVTPNSAYTYGSPAYTVTTGTASVSQSTNTFTATPSANCTIRINMVEKPKYTITYHVGSGSGVPASWTQTSYGESTTLPTATPSCDGWSFAGWCTSSAGDEDDNTTSPGTILTGEYTPTDNVDLYAVYTKTEGGGGTSDITIVPGTYTDKGTNNYGSGVERTGTVSTINLGAHYVTGNNAGTPGGSSTGQFLQCQGNNANIYNKTALPGRITQVVLNQNSATAFSLYCGDEQLMSSTNTATGQTPSGTIQTAQTAATTMTWTVSGDYTFFDIKKGSSAGYITSIVITYESGTTYYMTDYECAATPTITVSTEEIDFGDKKAGPGHSLSYTATFTVSGENLTDDIELEISGDEHTLFSVDKNTLTPDAGSVTSTTITVTWTPSPAFNQTFIHINSDGATEKIVHLKGHGKWEVTWKNDGEVYETTLVDSNAKPEFPATPTSCDTEESNLFYGWTNAEWSGKIDDVSTKTIYKSNASMTKPTDNSTIYYAVFVERTGSVDDYTDNLTRTTTTRPSTTTYGDWSGKSASNTGHSSAVYTGNSAGANDAIQLRSSNSSGIITTTSGGKAKKVTVVWESHTTSGRILDIYGKNAAYSATSDLYGTNEQKGTKIGSITEGTSTELTIDDDYAYIGIRSNDGALYLTSISIDWQDGDYTYSKYMTNCCDYYITVAEPTKTGTGTGTVAFASGGSAVAAGSDVATCAGTTTITATVTPNPGHQCDALSFTGGSVSVSPAIPDPFVPFDNAGATSYTLTFAQNTNATLATAVTFTVLQDYYIDHMHDNAKVTKSGNYGTAPSLSSTTPGDGCAGSHYKFIGWVPESDMNMETGVPNTTTHMVAGGQTGMYATGTNYYAIWAEEVTP